MREPRMPLPLPPFEIVLPATSANLGPAFDAAALAMDLHLRLRAAVTEETQVYASGRDADVCGSLRQNLVLDTYREVLRSEGRDVPPLLVRVENEIPVGKGLGSSAAARLAGIALAVHFGRLPWSDHQVLVEAARREHHADNAAACWLGGVALVYRACAGGAIDAMKVRTRRKWPLLIAVPDACLATDTARAILPAQYSRADAIANVQNSMLLAAAFAEGRPELFQFAFRDRLHEPYRGPLCPLLAPLRSLNGDQGVLGAALSGSGPSVLIMLDPRRPAARARDAVAAFLERENLHAELLLTRIDDRGARDRRKPPPARHSSSRSRP